MIFRLNEDETYFPPVHYANREGILAFGGEITPKRIFHAYKNGVFPWFDSSDVPLWWSPNPRFVIFPERAKISKSMKQLLRRNAFRVSFDTCCDRVIEGCRYVRRAKQNDEQATWISDEIYDAYLTLHDLGFVHSVEVWQGETLVGGLYGCAIGKCFFGESMFSEVSNASKYGFLTLARNLAAHGFELIDCQIHTEHLESLGGEFISRKAFIEIVKRNGTALPDPFAKGYSPENTSWKNTFQAEFQEW